MTLHLTCWTLCPLVTHSFPTFTLGWHRPLIRSAEFRPIKYATLSASVQINQIEIFRVNYYTQQRLLFVHTPSVPSASACSSLCFCLNFILPQCIMAPISLQMPFFSSGVKPSTSNASYKIKTFEIYELRPLEQKNKNVSAYISGKQFVAIVYGGYGCFSLGDVSVVIGVIGDEQHLCSR